MAQYKCLCGKICASKQGLSNHARGCSKVIDEKVKMETKKEREKNEALKIQNSQLETEMAGIKKFISYATSEYENRQRLETRKTVLLKRQYVDITDESIPIGGLINDDNLIKIENYRFTKYHRKMNSDLQNFYQQLSSWASEFIADVDHYIQQLNPIMNNNEILNTLIKISNDVENYGIVKRNFAIKILTGYSVDYQCNIEKQNISTQMSNDVLQYLMISVARKIGSNAPNYFNYLENKNSLVGFSDIAINNWFHRLQIKKSSTNLICP